MARTRHLYRLFAAFVLLPATAAGAVPPMIYNPDSPRESPVWVSADQAILDGSLRWELFGDFQVMQLEKSLAEIRSRVASGAGQGRECTAGVRWSTEYWGDAGDLSLEGVYRISTFAVTGEVVGAEVGFFGGTPSTLLEIEVERTVLPEETDWQGTRLFISYPEGQVPLAGGLLCGLGDRGGVTPGSGSRVLVFSSVGVDPARYPVLNPEDNELFFETDDGDLSAPVLGPGHPESWEELEQRLARLQGGVSEGSAPGPLAAARPDFEEDVPPASWGPTSVEHLKRALAAPPARPPMGRDPLQEEMGRLARARGKTVALILDLDDDGVRTVSLSSAVEFDINADGIPETTSWTFSHSREAFLGLDLDGDGEITTGRELFGAATEMPDGNLAPHSFAALAVYDGGDHGGDGDGLVTVADAVWPRLVLWVDGNHDGRSQPEEMSGLDANDVVAISLDYRDISAFDGTGNIRRYQGQYVRRVPRRGREPKLVAATAEAIVFRVHRPR